MTSKPDSTAAPAKGAKCAICGSPVAAEFRPFCSRRCADVDLARWLNGVYAIPSTDDDDDEDGDGGGGGGGGGGDGASSGGASSNGASGARAVGDTPGGRVVGRIRPRR